MSDYARGPEPGDWIFAAFRGLHPLRSILCLGGVAFTLLIAILAQAWFTGESPRCAEWWEKPVEQTEALAAEVSQHSFLSIARRLGPLLALTAMVWCLIGSWIARHELIARSTARPYEVLSRVEPGPTALVIGRGKALLTCCPIVLSLLGLFLLPMLAAGAVNRLGGAGAILVAVLLPVFLIFTLLLLAVATGALAFPLMPVTIAAENSDVFDALSRAYNYLYMRMFLFAVLKAIVLFVAALPLVIVLIPFADLIADWPPTARSILLWLATALSASIFWSLETLVYLHLRKSVDATDASEIATESEKSEELTSPADTTATIKETPPTTKTLTSRLLQLVQIMALVVASWCLTVWLFQHVGGEDSGWMSWGLGDQFRPPAEGSYRVASNIAGFWGAIWIGGSFYLTVRGWFRRQPQSIQGEPPASAGGGN